MNNVQKNSGRAMTRRDMMLSTGAAVAAGVCMTRDVLGADNPATNVADRTSGIRITSLKATPCRGKVFVKIETNYKVTGWGEVTGLEPKTAVALLQSLYEMLDDQNPTRIEYLWQRLYRAHRDMRGGPFMIHTIAAIDMALWDITGRLWGEPVYRLLGGPCRDKIRMYPNATAFKQAAGGPYPFASDPPQVEALVKRVKEARERVGPKGTVMFDAHACLPPATLIQFANAIEPYDVLWIEEPIVVGSIEAFKRIKEQIRVPLATGERDRTIWEFIPYLQNSCIDILQPDCCHSGGITQLKKIAALAEAYYVPIAPHCTMSELGLSASLHLVASIPLFLIHEGYLDGHLMPPGVAIKHWEVDKNGYASLPPGPGLGVDMDEAKMAEVAADPTYKWKWPNSKYPDGSPADY